MEIARGQLTRVMTDRGQLAWGVIVPGELSRGECVYLCNGCIMTVCI